MEENEEESLFLELKNRIINCNKMSVFEKIMEEVVALPKNHKFKNKLVGLSIKYRRKVNNLEIINNNQKWNN